ncbi:HlyIII-domain-containing protein [Gloeophyllum trabeum ATCC 11539]|uniref:HlyIII-domain-containing protein n=1 Tax=Gloeophyllum trabeum (strain ATCC 11539 / FP-39264 / Madison 617) TaxID=670483 RepID=S7PXB0_GLOTA|nr:HlyIII-domain-containing protein [Gloeophyllum trabeum ATCC 11539]EPQ52236.1 HlyIII-domain-containing protein [Gloeophyllum trabeum ATCC 11539]
MLRPQKVTAREARDAAQAHRRNQTPESRTVTWRAIEPWQRDNDYILAGYRRAQRSFRGCLASVFGYLHNETVNIHSHLWGALLFAYLLCTYPRTYLAAHATTTWADYVVAAIFLSSAVFCLASSAGMHTFSCHSEPVCARCHALDYTGIVVLIVGSFFPCVYYGFYCDPFWRALYLTVILVSGLGAAYIVLNPEYARPSHRGARTKVFIALGLSAVLPVTHALASHGFAKLLREMGFGWLVLSGALYIAGALLYANRIPERFEPGRFDYFFASHQIFHVCVVLAALAHYTCVLTAFEHWHSRGGQCV